MLGPQLPEARHAMHDEPREPPSGLQRELAAEAESPPAAPRRVLLSLGLVLGWVGLVSTAFYAYAVPAADPLAYRAALNAGVVVGALGLIAITLGLLHLLRPAGPTNVRSR